MNRTWWWWPCLFALVLVGCQDDGIVDPTTAPDDASPIDAAVIARPLDAESNCTSHAFGRQAVAVLTWNVYVGTDLDRIIGAPDPTMIPALVEQGWEDMLTVDFHARAAVIARKIALARPHLVGLQEITLLRTQSPGDAIVGGTTPATEVVLDYEAILMDALADLGLDYRVAARVENWDIEMPRANATWDDARVTDFDLVLARADVATRDATSHTYGTVLVVPVGGGPPIPIDRGFCSVVATIGRRDLLFVSTHFETQGIPFVQEAQAAELVEFVSTYDGPVVIVGDLNSEGDGSTTASHAMILEAGFLDVSAEAVHPFDDGMTCCNEPTLDDPVSVMEQWIDHVLYRPAGGTVVRNLPALAVVLGTRPWDLTPGGYWPSDHAGVAARFLMRTWPVR